MVLESSTKDLPPKWVKKNPFLLQDNHTKHLFTTGMSLEELENKYVKEVKPSANLQEAKIKRKQMERMIMINDWLLSFNIARAVYNYSPLRLITGPMPYKLTELPLNLGDILEVLLHVHAWEIFQDGGTISIPSPSCFFSYSVHTCMYI